MAITNFIPTVWSENLFEALDAKYIAVAHCNREFEGDIKNKGSVVKICGVGYINVSDYTKNTNMSEPQTLSDTVKELSIDQAKYFNFQIDDIDKAQCNPKVMERAMKLAASALAATADKHVLSLAANAELSVECAPNTPEDVINSIISAKEMIYQRNGCDIDNIVLEVSPRVASLILKAKLSMPFCDPNVLENGYLGSIAGCKVYVTNNLITRTDDLIVENDFCIMRSTRAIAFAEQLSEIDAYRPEKRFADAVKGLHLYGAQIIYPREIVCLKFGFSLS